MKKISLFALGIVALTTAASAQTPVTPSDFTSNPSKYNGQNISVSGVKLSKAVPSGMTCTPPRLFSAVTVEFPTTPAFKKCFFIPMALQVKIPGGANNATITFKSEGQGYTISGYKIQ